jgi:hypothetical protein
VDITGSGYQQIVGCFEHGSEIYTVILATNLHNDIKGKDKGKGKGKGHPRTCHEGPEESGGIALLFL